MTKLNRAKLLHKTLTDRGVPEGPGRMPIITAIQGVMDSVLGVQVKIEALPNLVIGNDDWLKDPIQKELVAQIRRLDSTKIKSASQIIKKLAAGNIDIRNMDDPTATDAINKASLQVEADKAPKQVIQDRITELFPTVKKINLPSLATRLFDGGYNLVGSNEDDKLLIKRAALSLKMNDAALK